MALIETKILDSERDAVQVKSVEGNRLTGTVAENKNVFDKFPQLVMDKHNALVEELDSYGLDSVGEKFEDRYTKEEVDAIEDDLSNTIEEVRGLTQDAVRRIVLNGRELPKADGTVEIWMTAEGGDMELFATKEYVDDIVGNTIVANELTIPADAWVLDEVAGLYKFTHEDAAITANTIVNINLDLASLEVAGDCGLKAVTESYDGGFYIYAEEVPASAMSGTLEIIGANMISNNESAVPANALAGVDGIYLAVEEE